MGNKVKESKKDIRIVVRVEPDVANWLDTAAKRDDSSISRIIRQAIRKFARESGAPFNDPEALTPGFAE